MTAEQHTIDAVKMLSEYFRCPLTEAAVKAYMIGLDGLPQGELEAAARRAIAECRFMPMVSELRAFAAASRPRPRVSRPIPD